MKYYVKCNNIFNNQDVTITNDQQEEVAVVSFARTLSSHMIQLQLLPNNEHYSLEVNKLKLKNRYQLLDEQNNTIMSISIGLKLIHAITINQKRHICKASFFRIAYTLYDGYSELGSIKLIKLGKERVFEIELKVPNLLHMLALYTIAQTIRERVYLS